RARWRNIAAAAVLAVAALLGVGTWYWDSYVRTKTSYFASYGERWGVPFGIGPLDETAARTQSHVYRLTIRSGRVVQMRRQNGSGGLMGDAEVQDSEESWTSEAARFVYTYHDDGMLASIAMFDQTDRPLRY